MDNFITYADFVGNRAIPFAQDDTDDFETNYITPYQKEIIIRALGYDLYLAFEAGLDEVSPLAKWTDLRDGSTYQVDGINKQNQGFKPIVLAYVYLNWITINYQQLTGVGNIKSNAENATVISPLMKVTTAWNEMILLYNQLYDFIKENEIDYPNFSMEVLKVSPYGF